MVTHPVAELGKYVVADPSACPGRLKFRGTRIPVDDVLKQVAAGKDWDSISRGTHGKIRHEAIAEALQLATTTLLEANPKNRGTETRDLGEYVIAHPLICHGALTVRGTRVFVEGVLYFVAKNMAWDQITREWHGSVSTEAIAEAVELARLALVRQELG